MYLRPLLFFVAYTLPLARADFLVVTGRPDFINAALPSSKVEPAIPVPTTALAHMAPGRADV